MLAEKGYLREEVIGADSVDKRRASELEKARAPS